MANAEHFCTYFDRGFLLQGLTLASSLRQHAPGSILWVLCLDDFTANHFEHCPHDNIRPVKLSELEAFDPDLLTAKNSRTRVEYYFTLSPCWPRFLFAQHPEISRLTYLDADLFFFNSPDAIFDEMGESSIFITAHNYPSFLSHHLRFGRFNVGVLSFRNDAKAHACLDHWRHQCLDWCRDCVEDGRYGDQKYLDQWPELWRGALCVSQNPGINLAPWNWLSSRVRWAAGKLRLGDAPLVVFHFARFRPACGTWLFHSGQMEYGVMPMRLRQTIYRPYWRALLEARDEVRRIIPTFDFPAKSARNWHNLRSSLLPRLIFGSDWIRIGPVFCSARLGLGRFSGRIISWLRRLCGARDVVEDFSPDNTVSANPFLVLPLEKPVAEKGKPACDYSSSSTFQ